MSILMNPDCLDLKHRACSGDGWCESTDQAVPCPCVCHTIVPGGSIGLTTSETITAHLVPTHTAMQAKHLSGASIGKLVEYEVGRSLTTNELQWSPSAELGHLTHGPDTIELHIRHSEANWGRITLTPTDWVRVTQPAGATA